MREGITEEGEGQGEGEEGRVLEERLEDKKAYIFWVFRRAPLGLSPARPPARVGYFEKRRQEESSEEFVYRDAGEGGNSFKNQGERSAGQGWLGRS